MIDDKFKVLFAALMKKEVPFEDILDTIRGEDKLSVKDVISVDDLTIEDIQLIFRITHCFKYGFEEQGPKKLGLLKGKAILNLFVEDSTRTRISFEIAGKELGADTINMGKSGSSLAKKGETLNDTARTIDSMNFDCIIIRHNSPGVPQMIAKEVRCPIINGGDGCHEHPTQALLDLYTIYEKMEKLKGCEVVIVGDISHSRVAGSLIRILNKVGANVCIAGPATLIPFGIEKMGVTVYHDIEKAVKDKDVIYALRIQLERAAKAFIPTVREYSKMFCITPERLKLAKPHCIVMHPGPINREVDLRTEVMEGPQSVVEEQVTNGYNIRLALLYLIVKEYEEKRIARWEQRRARAV